MHQTAVTKNNPNKYLRSLGDGEKVAFHMLRIFLQINRLTTSLCCVTTFVFSDTPEGHGCEVVCGTALTVNLFLTSAPNAGKSSVRFFDYFQLQVGAGLTGGQWISSVFRFLLRQLPGEATIN